MSRVWKKTLVSLMMLAGADAYAQQAVQWDVSSPQTIIAGQGCTKDVDAFASANGNDVAIVFTRLGIDLPGGGSRVLAGRNSCTVRIPARISAGIYIGKLTQTISYGVIKTAAASASVATRSQFFGFNVSPHSVNLPMGQNVNQPLLTQSREDRFLVQTTPDWIRGWCAPNRAPRGLYQANFAISGQKATAQDDLVLSVDGLDLKYKVGASLINCPLPSAL